MFRGCEKELSKELKWTRNNWVRKKFLQEEKLIRRENRTKVCISLRSFLFDAPIVSCFTLNVIFYVTSVQRKKENT